MVFRVPRGPRINMQGFRVRDAAIIPWNYIDIRSLFVIVAVANKVERITIG